MADASAVKLGNAIVTALNDGTFSQEFEAEYTYDTRLELENLDELSVQVATDEIERSPLDRKKTRKEIATYVAIRKKGTDILPATFNPLMRLVEEITDYLDRRELDEYPEAKQIGDIVNDPPFWPDHAREWRQFSSVLVITHAVKTEVPGT